MKRMTSLLMMSLFVVGCGSSEEPKQVNSQAKKATPASAPAANEAAKAKAQPAGKKRVTYEELLTLSDQLIEKRKGQDALKVLTTAIKAKPTRTEAYIKRAALLAEAKQLKLAVADMNSAIAVDAENPKFRNTRGYFLLLLKEYDAAEIDFNKAIDLDPEYPQVFNNRGLVFIGQNEHIKAMNDFRTAIKLKEDYVDALNNLGFVYLQMEEPDYEKAVESFSKVLELDADYINALSNRGRAYLKLDNTEAAIADFTRAIELQPKSEQYYLHRGEAYRVAGKDDMSRADIDYVVWLRGLNEINRRIANNPKNIDLWIARGRHLLTQDEIESAEKSFNNAITLDGTNQTALMERAKLHLQMDQLQEVVDVCTKSIEVNVTSTAQSLRGDAYLALGEFDKAIADYNACRRFDTRVIEAYRKRAEQHRENGKTELADADVKRADLLEKQLADTTPVETVAPRAFVPVNFEKTASAEEETESPK